MAARADGAPGKGKGEWFPERARVVLELGPEDRPITERARLKSAAQAEGVNLEIRRRGNTMMFWVTVAPPQPLTSKAVLGAGRPLLRRTSYS